MIVDDRKLVLIVDADETFVEHARDVLGTHRTLTARTVEEATALLSTRSVDLILLGTSFASETAIATATAVRMFDPMAPIVLVADIVTNRLLKAALRARLSDVVDTPLDAHSLSTVMAVDRVPATEVAVVVEAPDGSEIPIDGVRLGATRR
jgi:DNA-binding NtrC family response regulator